MPQEPYEQFDHDADLGLRVRGATIAALLENAARGMAEMMVDPASVNATGAVEILAEGEDSEMLLVKWLSEILFAFDVDHFMPASAEVTESAGGRVKGILRGETFDASRHEVRNSIKAVTYHNLRVRTTTAGLEVDIVFDV